MPLHIPTLGERVTEADIWAYPTRVITGGAPTEAAIWAHTTRELTDFTKAHFDITEFEISQAPPAENAVVSVAVVTADQSLGTKDITVNVPTGATITRVIALARISIMNDSANEQEIDLKFEVEGVVLFNQANVIGFPAIAKGSGSYVIAEDATDEVTADGQVVTLEAKATLSSANAIRFQAQYYLFITYRMG